MKFKGLRQRSQRLKELKSQKAIANSNPDEPVDLSMGKAEENSDNAILHTGPILKNLEEGVKSIEDAFNALKVKFVADDSRGDEASFTWETVMEKVTFPENYFFAQTEEREEPEEVLFEEAVLEKDAKGKVVCTVTFSKAAKDEKLGIALERIEGKRGIFIAAIQKGSKCESSGLRQGMKVLAINGKPCPRSVKATMKLLASIEGKITIKASREDATLIIEESYDNFEDTVLSLTTEVFGAPTKNVDSSDDESDDDYSEVDEHIVDEVNVVDDIDRFRDRVKATDAYWKKTSLPTRSVTISKVKNETLGVVLRQYKHKEGIFVSKVMENSKFYKSSLVPETKLLYINDKACPQNVDDCLEMMGEIEGAMEIVFELAPFESLSLDGAAPIIVSASLSLDTPVPQNSDSEEE